MNFKLPALYDAKGDLSKQWFVFYSVRHPQTKTFKRIKIFEDINNSKIASGRRANAGKWIAFATEYLEAKHIALHKR
ncbi:MAG TPA: hypothetical protein VNI52_05090 [Sphingobacteriaceae bacterium]|nr:hypothetical protein [Sphingobacteriaceae bacterium]